MSTGPPPITRKALVAALASCRIENGDTVVVHSSLRAMGPVEGGREAVLPTYYEAIREAVGDSGTLVVPAFFYEYARWETPYDLRLSPVSKELGAFAQYVVQQPESRRSPNPVAAMAAVGAGASYICDGGTGSAFGVDSPWDRLLKCDGKMAFLGTDLRAMTFCRYVEYVVGVPFVYNKFYPVPVTDDGHPVDLPICAQVRFLDFDIEWDFTERLTKEFEEAGLVRTAKAGQGTIRCVETRPAFDYLKEHLKRDFFYLLKRPPAFVPGKIPMDGAAGPARP